MTPVGKYLFSQIMAMWGKKIITKANEIQKEN